MTCVFEKQNFTSGEEVRHLLAMKLNSINLIKEKHVGALFVLLISKSYSVHI